MADKPTSSLWLNKHPILDASHARDLEQAAAINEFHRKQPRAQAEQAAHDDYRKEQHTKAAAHHFQGMRAAHGAGDMEEAKLHGNLYAQHMNAMGLDPYGPVPEHIRLQAADPQHTKVYRFANHRADALLSHSMSKSEGDMKTCPHCHKVLDKHDWKGRTCLDCYADLDDPHGALGSNIQPKTVAGGKETTTPKQGHLKIVKSEDLAKGSVPVPVPVPTTWRRQQGVASGDHPDTAPYYPHDPAAATYDDPPVGRALDHDGLIYEKCKSCGRREMPTRKLPYDGPRARDDWRPDGTRRLHFGGHICQECDAKSMNRDEQAAQQHGQARLKDRLTNSPQANVETGFASSGVAKSERLDRLLKVAKLALALKRLHKDEGAHDNDPD